MLLMLSKGKHASATEIRRFVWNKIVWPLILEVNDVVFTLEQYQKKRDEVSAKYDIDIHKLSRGLASLQQKGLLFKEKKIYSIHYRHIPYMRLKAECDYATALNELKLAH